MNEELKTKTNKKVIPCRRKEGEDGGWAGERRPHGKSVPLQNESPRDAFNGDVMNAPHVSKGNFS